MPSIIQLNNHQDSRGVLYVIDQLLPFDIKRVYYIKNVPGDVVRGGHKHKTTWQAAVCISGSCKFVVAEGDAEKEILLDNASQCLVLAPEDWHEMREFSPDAILLVLASEHYDKNDYIDSK